MPIASTGLNPNSRVGLRLNTPCLDQKDTQHNHTNEEMEKMNPRKNKIIHEEIVGQHRNAGLYLMRIFTTFDMAKPDPASNARIKKRRRAKS